MGVTLPPFIVILLRYSKGTTNYSSYIIILLPATLTCILVPDANCDQGFHSSKVAGLGAGKSYKLVFQSRINRETCSLQEHLITPFPRCLHDLK